MSALNSIPPSAEGRDALKLDLVRLHLSATVPLEIHDVRTYSDPGLAIERARRWTVDLCECEDTFFSGRRTGELAGKLTQTVAALAFVPGGVRCFGLHFCAAHHPGGIRQESQFCEECAAEEARRAPA